LIFFPKISYTIIYFKFFQLYQIYKCRPVPGTSTGGLTGYFSETLTEQTEGRTSISTQRHEPSSSSENRGNLLFQEKEEETLNNDE